MSATCAARTIAAISFGNVTKRSFESGAVCSNDATNATRPSRSGRTSASSRNVSSAPVRRSVNEGSGDAAAVDRLLSPEAGIHSGREENPGIDRRIAISATGRLGEWGVSSV